MVDIEFIVLLMDRATEIDPSVLLFMLGRGGLGFNPAGRKTADRS